MSACRQFVKRQFPRRLASGSVIALSLMSWSSSAFAYRPFDGTDGAVAVPGEVEIELQPAGRLREEGSSTLVAPATVFNYGLSEGWEAVFEGQGQTPLSPLGPTSLTCCFPTAPGIQASGASLAGIVSQRWDWGTIHLNAETTLTRDHQADVFLGGIIEGPSKWSIRPVAEFFYEREFSQSETISGLVGLIWRVRDNFSFDVGLRHALTNGHPVNEVRAGLTFGFPLGQFDGRPAQSR